MSRAPRAIEKAVASAANRAEWLRASDAGALRLAKRLAETLDDLYAAKSGTLPGLEAAEESASKTAYVAQTLIRILNDLGLTATARDALGYGSPAPDGDPLAGIRTALADVIEIT